MFKRPFAALWLIALSSAPVVSGCKEDPPPPPVPDAPLASGKSDPHHPKSDRALRGGMQVPKISPETMKAYRIETCYFGTMAIRLARDNYLASLGGAEPSATKLPSFGEFPNVQLTPTMPAEPDGASAHKTAPGTADAVASGKVAAAPGRVPGMGGMAGRIAGRGPMIDSMGNLPFLRHVRSCSVAKTLKNPSAGDLDQKLEGFDTYVSELTKVMLDAQRYYGRKQFEKDDFKHGAELHKTLTNELPKLDEQLKSFGHAVNDWYAKLPAQSEKLDEGGTLCNAAVADARAVTLLLLAEEPDQDAVKQAAAKVHKHFDALDTMRGQKVPPPHSRIVTPKLQLFLVALDDALAKRKLSATLAYKLTFNMAELIEANQRGLAQLLRSRGETMPATDDALTRPRVAGVPAPGKENEGIDAKQQQPGEAE